MVKGIWVGLKLKVMSFSNGTAAFSISDLSGSSKLISKSVE